MDIEDAARQMYYASKPEIFPWARNDGRDYKKARVLRRRVISVTVNFTPEISLSSSFEGRDYKSSLTDVNRLPADVQAKLKAALATIAEQYKDVKPGQYGTGEPARNVNTAPP
jgi:hypothetical protein